MDKLFQYLGKRAGISVKKGRWFYKSILGNEEETIKAQFSFGYEMAKEIANKYKLVEDPIIKKLGTELKTRLSTKHRFNFYTIKSTEVNAFALPGGFIFVTKWALDFDESSQTKGLMMSYFAFLNSVPDTNGSGFWLKKGRLEHQYSNALSEILSAAPGWSARQQQNCVNGSWYLPG